LSVGDAGLRRVRLREIEHGSSRPPYLFEREGEFVLRPVARAPFREHYEAFPSGASSFRTNTCSTRTSAGTTTSAALMHVSSPRAAAAPNERIAPLSESRRTE